MEQVTYWKCSG